MSERTNTNMPDTPKPTPVTDPLPALVEPEDPTKPVEADAEPSGPLTPASEPLIQAEAKPEPKATEQVEEGPLQPATEPLTGQYQEEAKPETAPVEKAAPLKPASEPLIQTEVEQAPAPTGPTVPLTAVPAIPQEILADKPHAQEPVEPPKYPKGLIVLLVLNVIGAIVGILEPARGTQLLIVVGNFLSLAVVAGVAFRYEIARKAAVYLSAALILLTGFVTFSLFAVKTAMNQNVLTTRERVESVLNDSNGNLTLQQRDGWQKRLKELETERRVTDRAVAIALIYNGVITLVYVGQMVYLTRPGVRSAFRLIREDD